MGALLFWHLARTLKQRLRPRGLSCSSDLATTEANELVERFWQLAENIHEGFIIVDVEFQKVLYMSPAFARITDLDANEIQTIGAFTAAILAKILPGERQALADAVEAGLGGEPVDIDFSIMRRDGRRAWICGRSFPASLKEGRIRRIAGTVEDISRRKLAEAQLRESAERFRALAEVVPHAVWTATPSGQVEYVNQYATKLVGADDPPTFARLWNEAMDPNERTQAATIWEEALRTGQATISEHRIRTLNGPYRWFKTVIVPARKTDGAISQWLCTGIDITNFKESEQRLKAARDAADAANAAKSQFLANMSHEIRSPLGAIIGFSELLRNDLVDERERDEFLDRIIRNGRNLTQLIDDILDLSRVESGRVELEVLATSLRSLTQDLSELFEQQAVEKGLTFSVSLAPDLPDVILTDPTRLRQILVNLASNALKFTARGQVNLAVRQIGKADGDKVSLQFLVSDTGIGVPAAQQGRLFRPFVQADATTTREYGGTGLGLVLARRLANLLGGDVVLVESEPGRGSTFAATIVARAADVPAAGVIGCDEVGAEEGLGERPLAGQRILVAEDSSDLRIIISHLLQARGGEVTLAENGKEALRMAESREFDLVLMDIQMPHLDGYETARTLRRRCFRKPIIALTAHAMKDERERCMRAGFSSFLAKPVRAAELIRILARHAGRVGHPRMDAAMTEAWDADGPGVTRA